MNSKLNKDHFYSKRDFFDTGNTKSYDFRIQQLEKLKATIKNYEEDIFDALYMDLHKSGFESYTSEVGFIYEEINYTIKHLKNWMKPKRVRGSISTVPSKSYIYPEPLGIVLIIGPWNYPFQLIMAPLIGAIAAGNCSIVKPSNQSVNTSLVIEKIIEEIFPREYISVIQGSGSTLVPNLIKDYSFNHIFFTGSMNVGKDILALASNHLTPVTLELGGKSPTIVHKDANLSLAAKRMIAGKYYNAGQTCISPDYLLVHEDIKEELIAYLIRYIKEFYGDNPKASKDYGRIINKNRFNTLMDYLKDEDIILGGDSDIDDLYIEPTILECKDTDTLIMKEEIFGPILPILTYKEIGEVVDIVRKNRYPLALYLFTNDKKIEQFIIGKVEFGGGCINNSLLHILSPKMPFGGVGSSGMGRYHGKYTFDTFTHYKSILKSHNKIDIPLRYPPYEDKKLDWVKKIMK
ncbi:MAG: aldehyde dehydrogenase [Tissierella sp.]|nr:aldehyde dehydrogenase [Tissierella sp.]